MISAPMEKGWTVIGMDENRDRSCYTCFHRHACVGMMEAQGLADYVSLGAQSAERCPDYIYSGDVAMVRHGRWVKGNGYVECSECHTMGSQHWKCCPVCTARMDLEDLLRWGMNI